MNQGDGDGGRLLAFQIPPNQRNGRSAQEGQGHGAKGGQLVARQQEDCPQLRPSRPLLPLAPTIPRTSQPLGHKRPQDGNQHRPRLQQAKEKGASEKTQTQKALRHPQPSPFQGFF
ncbi:MAG: hypothetical protein SLRJCFUN_000497, partial [Candidatus Fervidibacter sp.]